MVTLGDDPKIRAFRDAYYDKHKEEFAREEQAREAVRRAAEHKAAEEAEKKRAARRSYLLLLSARPIATQIKALGSLEVWRQQYQSFEVSNKKVDQIIALERLQNWSRTERKRSEGSLAVDLQFDTLPLSKRQQYDARLRECPGRSLDECFVRMYTAAEWAFEKWAKKTGLDPVNLNAINLYDQQDYRIRDLNVNVKTTISVGQCEMKSYWSPIPETKEIICAVTSWTPPWSTAASTSRHYIQGIFHSPVYEHISVRLNHFRLDSSLFNACYFHSPEIFFKVAGTLPPQTSFIDADVADYCAENGKCLAAIFRLTTQDAAALLRRALPPALHDFVPVAAELMNRTMRHLLPHYLADYLLTKILRKESIDTDAVENVLYSIFEPYRDQKRYLGVLIEASRILPAVRCAHHPDEGIDRMGIEANWGEQHERVKLILRARCSINRNLSTTFLAYSWKTGETLVYGGPDISVCDVPGCGCLTHIYNGSSGSQRIGRRGCSRYGDPSLHLI